MNKVATYSPSITIALTRACANRCRYCGFREDGDGLLPFAGIQTIAIRARNKGMSEVLLMSGENADSVPPIKESLKSLGLVSMVAWTRKAAEYLLSLNLLPHINIGVLSFTGLQDLKGVSASMGLMMEGDYGSLGAAVHPQKNFAHRLQNLAWAGQLRIPFTTGILVGLGETQKDRLRSIQAIADCGKIYGHIQEIILQNYVPNRRSPLPAHKISPGELKELIDLAREILPEVSLQNPPNLSSSWADLLALGFDDLGGISNETDLVNREYPWPSIETITEILKQKKYRLRKRLPIYPKYYRQGWFSPEVGRVIEKWIQSNHEYQYYTQ